MRPLPDYVPDPRATAEFRLMVLGDVLAYPPDTGERRRRLRLLAERPWQHPDGHRGPIGLRTLERWLARVDGATDRIAALMPMERKDKGRLPSVTEEHRERLRNLWKERPEALWRNHYRNLLAETRAPHSSFSSVKRFLRKEGLFRIPEGEEKEKREKLSFEAAFVNEVWHLDAHHGSCRVVDDAGQWQVAKLIAFLDDHSRFVCHAQWYLQECCREICAAFEQAALKCAIPRAVHTDNGSCMRGSEFGEGLRRLGVLLRFTEVESPYKKGKLERYWGTLERQLMQMVPKDKPMTLAELNRYTQASILKDYHLARHSELKSSPEEAFLNHARIPERRTGLAELRSAFRRTVLRSTRLQDGTVQIEGVRFQLPESYRHLRRVFVRFASWNLGVAELVDGRTRCAVAELYPVDKQTNSHSRRAPKETLRPQPNHVPAGLAPHLAKLCRDLDAETGIANFNPTLPIVKEFLP